MSTHIYCNIDEDNLFDTVAEFGEDDWDLPSQIDELEQWLSVHLKKLNKDLMLLTLVSLCEKKLVAVEL